MLCLVCVLFSLFFFFFNDTATTEIYTLSLHDALPIAMACGTPMIVSDNLGFRWVIDGGEEAVIIPKDDPTAWADMTIALLGDPERRAAMGRAGVVKAARFAWPRIARAELAVYERVLGRR